MELPSKDDIDEYSGVFTKYQNISLNEIPTYMKWSYPPMYKESQTEGVLYWRVGFDGETNELVTEHGYDVTSTGKKGKLQVDRLLIGINNLHKNILDKALQDAKRMYEDKYKEGYTDEFGNSIQLPLSQLANKYPLPGQLGKNPLKTYNFTRGLIVQPKLDGIRARVWKINGVIKIYSREFNLHPWLDTYIKPELNLLFDYLPTDVGVDCELYNPNIGFEELTSIIKTYKHKHSNNDNVYCYMFDLIQLKVPFEERYSTLEKAYVKLMNTHQVKRLLLVANSVLYEEILIKEYHDEYVNLGYEGMIIRKKSGNTKKQIEETWYKPGRNNNLLKVKNFIDEEGIVVDIIPGVGRESELGIIIIKDIRENEFSVRPRGSFEWRREILRNKEEYIGKKYTIRYFELSPYGVPRFPIGIAFRDYE